MPSEHGRVLCRIWRDADFRALSIGAQRMYLMLLSQPNIDNAGIVPMQIHKWSLACDDTDEEDVRQALAELSDTDFAYFDVDTEEVFVRSYIRNDGILKQPNLVKNALRCVRAVESAYLRLAVAIELRRIDRDDCRAAADELDPSGTAAEAFEKAHETLSEPFPMDSETLPEPIDQNARSADSGETLSKPFPKGAGRGRGKSLISSENVKSSKDKNPSKSSIPKRADARRPAAPDAATQTHPPEWHITNDAYLDPAVNKGFKFVGVQQIVKSILGARGDPPAAVTAALVAVHESGRPITRQTLCQYLDGHANGHSHGALGKASTNALGWLATAETLNNPTRSEIT